MPVPRLHRCIIVAMHGAEMHFGADHGLAGGDRGMLHDMVAQEIADRSAETGMQFDWLVMATGSTGTQAGLVAGFAAIGHDLPVMGVFEVDDDGRITLWRDYFDMGVVNDLMAHFAG